MKSIQSSLVVFMLGLTVFIHQGYRVHAETCKCTEINDMVKAKTQEAMEQYMQELNDTLQSLLEPIQSSIDYHLSVIGTEKNPAQSCKKLKELKYDSGHYWVKYSGSTPTVKVYCDMSLTCGGITGGWMRVADLDMRDSSQSCPSGFSTITRSSKRLCDNPTDSSCASTSFSVHKIYYDHACGRIIGYQRKDPLAFHYSSSYNSLTHRYVYGVSLSYSGYHMWTFAGASDESTGNPTFKCPCINTNIKTAIHIPTFVANDYFCDTALSKYSSTNDIHVDDPLWDGKGCGSNNDCCNFPTGKNKPPWFYKKLTQTNGDIKMNLCRPSSHGSTPIEIVELYVQ